MTQCCKNCDFFDAGPARDKTGRIRADRKGLCGWKVPIDVRPKSWGTYTSEPMMSYMYPLNDDPCNAWRAIGTREAENKMKEVWEQ